MATIYILYVTYLLKTILFEGKYAFIRLLVKYFFSLDIKVLKNVT